MSDPLRNHRTEDLLNGTAFICGANRGGALSQRQKGQLVGRGVSQSALVHPNRWSGEGSSQALCDKGTRARGGCHIPGKPLWRKNCDDKPAVTARDAFHARVPARAIRKVFGSAAHIAVPAWLGQGVLASTDRRKKINPQHANHSTVLLSA